MRDYFCAFCMCQSMFCAIPFPGNVWEEKARGKMLLFLPAVGLEIGAIWALIAWGAQVLALPKTLSALAVSVWPFLATGGIHLDGFMDVTDAVKSCRSPERRREILKDSHVGSFAVIGVALVLLAQFACSGALSGEQAGALVLLPVVSRCCSALAVTALRPMSTSQYAGQSVPKGQLIWLVGVLIFSLLAGAAVLKGQALALVGCGAGYALALRRSFRSLDGMNGDIAGYCLTLGELTGLAVLALV